MYIDLLVSLHPDDVQDIAIDDHYITTTGTYVRAIAGAFLLLLIHLYSL